MRYMQLLLHTANWKQYKYVFHYTKLKDQLSFKIYVENAIQHTNISYCLNVLPKRIICYMSFLAICFVMRDVITMGLVSVVKMW